MGSSSASPPDAFLKISYLGIYLCYLLILFNIFLFKAFTHVYIAIFTHLSRLPCPCKLAFIDIKYINTEILKQQTRKELFGTQALLSDFTDYLSFLYF